MRARAHAARPAAHRGRQPAPGFRRGGAARAGLRLRRGRAARRHPVRDAQARRIPLYGGCDDKGYFTVVCSEDRLDQGGYSMDADPNGNSYMQIVRFPAGGVEAHTFPSHSFSDDPASPHHADYTRAYSAGQWVRQPFSQAEIEADAACTSVTVSE
jgi:hypothetical protein